jgi:3-hydroxyacyl-[acyl-carrier-protein] dehydratase
VPRDIERFPAALALEAAGQLAAWVAMSRLDFRLRPVAGVAGDIRFGRAIRPGQVLELSVDIEDCDEESVRYSASAHVDGIEVLRLGHSLGPMLPMDMFDDPEAVSQRFAQLCEEGVAGDVYRGVPRHDIEIVELVPGESVSAILRVPAGSTAFFHDHFPRKPVFPGTMLLDALIEVSLKAAAGASNWAPAAEIVAAGVPDTKIRSFISPGDLLELHAQFIAADGDRTMRAKVSVRQRGRQISSGALEIEDRSHR